MSGNKKNTSLYSSSDILKYLRGELSAPEMNALEKAALDDPFLADALEGIGSISSTAGEASYQDGMDELKKRLDDRIARKNKRAVIPLRRSTWIAAASVILLAGLGMEVYLLSGSKSKMFATDIAKANVPSPAAPVTASAPVASETDSTKISASASAGAVSSGAAISHYSDTDGKSANLADGLVGTRDGSKAFSPLSRKMVTPAGEQTQISSKAKMADAEKEAEAKKESDTGSESRALARYDASDAKGRKARQDRMALLQNAPKRDLPGDFKRTATEHLVYKDFTMDSVRRQLSFRNNATSNNNAIRTGPSNSNNALGAANNSVAGNGAPAAAKENLSKKISTEDELKKIYYEEDKYIFTGKVIDENSLPVTGATLFLAGRPDNGTVSDNKGVFQLKVGKRDSALRLLVNYVGYEPVSMDLNTDNFAGNIIQLRPASSTLNEVVAQGFGASRKGWIAGAGYRDSISIAAGPKISAKNAEPSNGLPAWAGWLEKNWRAAGANLGRKGSETVSFTVNKQGVVSDFKIEQSLSPAHDSVLVNLILQGPAWKLQKGKKSRVTVTAFL